MIMMKQINLFKKIFKNSLLMMKIKKIQKIHKIKMINK